MPIVFISIIGMILFSYKLHDIVTANITANEAAEIYGHMPEGWDPSEAESYGNRRLDGLFSGKKYIINIESTGDGSRTSVAGEEGTRIYEDAGYFPQRFMRRMTVIEEIASDEK